MLLDEERSAGATFQEEDEGDANHGRAAVPDLGIGVEGADGLLLLWVLVEALVHGYLRTAGHTDDVIVQ